MGYKCFYEARWLFWKLLWISDDKYGSSTMALTSAPTRVVSVEQTHAGIASPNYLSYLEGLRGLAALYVVLYHTQGMVINLPRPVELALTVIGLGRFSVTIFIVLSGYCLMLPVAQSDTGRLKGGFGGYIKRRARRILPPYYAALVLSLVLFSLLPAIHPQNLQAMPDTISDFSPQAILSHLVLIHNLRVDWALSINAPMWSVATEWQIYFLFGLLLLPIWRRYGLGITVIAAFILGLLPFYFLRMSDLASPWFLGVFALGMAGAVVNFSQDARIARLRVTIPWKGIALAFFIGFIALIFGLKLFNLENLMRQHFRWVLDTVLGIGTMALLIYCTNIRLSGTDKPSNANLVLRILESPPVLILGSFSYSLYLIHTPLLELFYFTLAALQISPVIQLTAMILVAVPIVVAAAYVFYRVFEQPFMASRRKVHPKTA
jgi:peptidoglycan/LPS O-acetylase OafA/YrhL